MYRDRVRLFVDCKDMEEQPMDPRGFIDINGNISISKFANSRETVPVSFVDISCPCFITLLKKGCYLYLSLFLSFGQTEQ